MTFARTYRFLDLVMVLFVTVLLTSNIASSAKIVDWGVSGKPKRTLFFNLPGASVFGNHRGSFFE